MVRKRAQKGGRPRRAGTEKLKKMSISIRQVAFESLELIARQRRTSVSQTIEYLALKAAQETEVDGSTVFAVASQQAEIKQGARGDLLRMSLTPPSVRTALESFTVETLEAIGDYEDISDKESEVLVAIIDEMLPGGKDPEFVASAWAAACEAMEAGKRTFKMPSLLGTEEHYVMERGPKGELIVNYQYF